MLAARVLGPELDNCSVADAAEGFGSLLGLRLVACSYSGDVVESSALLCNILALPFSIVAIRKGNVLRAKVEILTIKSSAGLTCYPWVSMYVDW